MHITQQILQVKNLSKSFGKNKVLDNISFQLRQGEVHALMGENGAGKSTFMNILAGLLQPDEGSIELNGNRLDAFNPIAHQKAGIAMIHQEIMMIPELTVGQNIFLGREKEISGSFLINDKKLHRKANEILKDAGVSLDASARMKDLSLAEMQMVEIAKAISYDACVIIMDEPTSAISDREVEKLFNMIGKLKKKGVGLIYISHKMDEIFRVADTITVLRDGRYIGTEAANHLDHEMLVTRMVGRKIETLYPESSAKTGHVLMTVKDLSLGDKFNHIEFDLHQGEVLGMAGLMGAGRTEIALALYGMQPASSGTIAVNNQIVRLNNVHQAIQAGIGYVSEDRKNVGLITSLTIQQNMSLSSLSSFATKGWIMEEEEVNAIEQKSTELQLKSSGIKQVVGTLSGGNQQKVVLGKVLMANPQIIILDEPTRGVDIGAKSEIYKLIRQLTALGKGVLLISSELPEILGLSDRIMVISEGRQTALLSRQEASQELIMKYAAPGLAPPVKINTSKH